jgi:hypothetical protein
MAPIGIAWATRLLGKNWPGLSKGIFYSWGKTTLRQAEEQMDHANKPVKALSWRRKLVFSVITLCAAFLILELCFRIFFAFMAGSSAFLYGTGLARQEVSASPEKLHDQLPEVKTFRHEKSQNEWNEHRNVVTNPNELQGYSKYFPNQKKIDFDVETGERFEVTINSRGFRGREFFDRKEPGVIRIVTLGSSSTFGYFNKDDSTYPVYLERILNESYSGKLKFEVINVGIPHLTSAQILGLFSAEVIQLKPDIVTFYEGNNDSEPPKQWLNKSLVHAAIKKAGRVFMVPHFLDSISSSKIQILYPSMSDKEVSHIRETFLSNISEIYHQCQEDGICLLLPTSKRILSHLTDGC